MNKKDALKICRSCSQRTKTKNPLLVPKYIYTCGEYLKKVKGVSCGCIISLKTLFNKITGLFSCPERSKEYPNGRW